MTIRGVKVDQLPTFDIEYLFLIIRGKSVGEEVEVKITAPDDGETQIPVTIALDEFKVSLKIHVDHGYAKKLERPSSTIVLFSLVFGLTTSTVCESLGIVSKNFSICLN